MSVVSIAYKADANDLLSKPLIELNSFQQSSPVWQAFPESTRATIDWKKLQILLFSDPLKALLEITSLKENFVAFNSRHDQMEALVVELEAKTLLYLTAGALDLGRVLSNQLDDLDDIQKIRALANYGTSLANVGRSKEGMDFLNQALALARKIANTEEIIRRLNDLAWVSINLSQRELAMQHAVEAESLSRLRPDTYERAYSLMTVAGIHTQANHAEQSLELSFESVRIYRKLGYDFSESMVLFNIMNAYSKAKDYSKAIEIGQQILPISSRLGDESTRAYIYLTMALAFKNLNQPGEAIKYYGLTLPILREFNDVTALATALEPLINLYLDAKQTDKALVHLVEYKTAIQKAFPDKLPFSVEAQYLSTLARTEIASNELDKAVQTLRLRLKMADQRIRELTEKTIETMGSEIELEMKKKQNEALKALSQSQEESIQALKRVRDLFIVSLLLALLLCLTLYRSHLKNQKIREQKSKMDTILNTIGEGIVKFGPDFQIAEEQSRYSRILLNHGADLQGENLLKLLATSVTPSGSCGVDMLSSTCTALWGEKTLAWDLNSGNLPSRIHLNHRDLSLHWQPIFHEDKISSILLVLSDVTELIQSQRKYSESTEKARVLFDKIGFHGVNLSKALVQAQELAQYLKRNSSALQSFQSVLLPSLHTFKGNLRGLGMSPLHEYVHRLETALSERVALDDIMQAIARELSYYQDIADSINFDKSKKTGISLLSEVDEVYSDLFSRMEVHAVPVDRMELIFNEANFSPEVLQIIKTFLVHGLNNALDHGFILPLKTDGKSLSNKAQFTFEIDKQPEHMKLMIRDNGKGLNLEKLRELCDSKHIVIPPGKNLTDILFLDQVTTAAAVTATSGRGVGLSALRELAEKKQGSVKISNRTDRSGTILILEMPLGETSEEVPIRPVA